MAYKRNTRKGLKKRGFQFQASIGKGVPFIGGSSIRLGTRANAVKKIVRRELNKNEETKIWATSDLKSTGLLQNTLYTISPMVVAVGTGVNQRIGTQIFVRHLKVRLAISNTNTQSSIQFRILTLWSDKQYALDWTAYGAALGSTDIFYPSNNYTGALINNKLDTRIICDKIYTVKTDISGQLIKKNYSYDCPIMKKVTYLGANNLVKDSQLYIVIIPTTPLGVNGVTAVGDISAQALLTYKDA